jgi:hypothetical protein
MTKEIEVKERKHPHLWQSYLWYNEIVELRKRHNLRISAVERGASNFDADFEKHWINIFGLDQIKKDLAKVLANNGSLAGPVWEWITSIKGLGAGLLPAQLLAQIDDIGNSPTVSALWRFCGYAVFDGKAEKGKKGEKSHYNRRLKGVCYVIADTFIKQQTPGYVDIYYNEKARQRALHPVAVCRECGIECDVKEKKHKGEIIKSYVCPNNSKHVKNFTDAHIHYRAIRKMMKAFLRDLWIEWRKCEGLPISDEWA